MDDMKMKVLLYLKKSSRDRSGKAPIMGRITLGRSIAQFSCKLFCNPDLWNPRESRVDGKSREAVEVNGRLDNLLLAVQSSYQSLLAKGSPFDATDIKEHFQGSVQSRTMLLERFDGLIKDMEEHVGIDIKRESLVLYRQTRMRLQQFIRAKHNASDLTFSQLTENFIKQFEQFVTGEVGLKQSTCYNMIVLIKKVCKLAYREGAADSLLFDNVHVDKGDNRKQNVCVKARTQNEYGDWSDYSAESCASTWGDTKATLTRGDEAECPDEHGRGCSAFKVTLQNWQPGERVKCEVPNPADEDDVAKVKVGPVDASGNASRQSTDWVFPPNYDVPQNGFDITARCR